jgi:hypothetical protein
MILLCFVFTALIYAYIGVIGYFVIRDMSISGKADTIMDYFLHDRATAVVLEFIYCLHLISVLPSINKLMRLRFASFIEDFNKYLFNLLIVLLEFLLVFFRKYISLQFVLDVNGGLFNYFLVFVFPCYTYLAYIRAKEEPSPRRYFKEGGLWIVLALGLLVSVYGLVHAVQVLVEDDSGK